MAPIDLTAGLFPPGTALPSLFEVWGPITIGVLLSVFGMGILLMQTISYFDSSPTDSRYLRSVILFILALNFGQTISDCSRLIKLNVYHPGDYIYLFDIRNRPEELISPSISLVICTLAQLFLLRRCVIFARLAAPTLREKDGWAVYVRVAWRVVLFLGIVFGVICGIVTIVGLKRLNSLMEAHRASNPNTLLARWIVPWLGCTSATDICLSATLLWELRAARKNEDSDSNGSRAIRAMVRVAWSNGVLVGALQLVSLFFLLFESASWGDFPQIFISKVYSITLLASITSPISALRALPPPLSPPLGPTPHPLPMLFMHKNPSAEWSPSTPEHRPYPLRNADCLSAEHSRGAGRARLYSTGGSSSAWDPELSGVSEVDSPGTGVVLSTPSPPAGRKSGGGGWREVVGIGLGMGMGMGMGMGNDEGKGEVKRGKTLVGRAKPVERRMEEEVSMDVRVEGGSRTFGSVGGVPGTKPFGSVVGEAL